ncbi:GspH/FimT family pseudopilin [Massilia solisilvae]|uniref:Type II secretion system protein H n=1 Tax=Massilia solisilvae TaxID=1811225 RepID=A0ABT2BJZ3_9BURK|nr:GspH/FimT family pseudopilin [Massilia solisilvae]MCS0608832.1 GspH/FimT family pseudopilin [Massilia solisilvae]
MRSGRNVRAARRRRRGFSLLELLAVLAMAVIVFAVGAPSLAALVRAQQIRLAAGELFDAIGMTRAQAMARNERVEMLANGLPGNDWSLGWTVFVDRDGDHVPGAGDEILAVHGPLPRPIATAFSFTAAAPPYYIAYNGAGRSCSDTNSAAARMGTVSLFDGPLVRRIKINMLGRVRLCDPSRDSDCDGPDVPP